MFRDIDADCYILVDGDNTYPASAAIKMEELVLSKQADMVIGDRLSSTYFDENKRLFHNTGNRLVRKFINILFKSNLKDIMTGLRSFSYEFVKSFPITSKEFEIETEMSIFALNHNFLIKEIPIDYKDRIEGSESKLNTYSDGLKVIKLILSFFRDTRPLLFFSIATFVLVLISLIYFTPIFITFLETGYVEKIPTLLISASVVIVAVIIFFSGVILHVIKRNHNQDFEHFLTNLKINKKD